MSGFNVLLSVSLLFSSASAQRLSLRKPDFRIKTGKVNDIGRIDYDPKSGDYIFQWKGFDGKLKRAVYVPPWKAIVTVTAMVRQESKGFHYTYVLRNAPNSPQAVGGFSIKMSLEPQKVRVSNNWQFWGVVESIVGKLAEFSSYGRRSLGFPLKAGSSLKIEFFSPFPPGVVKCYAYGVAPIMRVPEEMPGELAERLPKGITQEFLHGFTIAPIEKPSLHRLISDWNIAVKEGWVKDKELAKRFLRNLQHILRLLAEKRFEEAKTEAKKTVDFARQNQKLLEPEARALLWLTLPYLVGGERANFPQRHKAQSQ